MVALNTLAVKILLEVADGLRKFTTILWYCHTSI
jgi:hypothetical protein